MDCLWSEAVGSVTSCSTLTQCLQVLTDDGSSLVGRVIDPACIPDTDVALLNGAEFRRCASQCCHWNTISVGLQRWRDIKKPLTFMELPHHYAQQTEQRRQLQDGNLLFQPLCLEPVWRNSVGWQWKFVVWIVFQSPHTRFKRITVTVSTVPTRWGHWDY